MHAAYWKEASNAWTTSAAYKAVACNAGEALTGAQYWAQGPYSDDEHINIKCDSLIGGSTSGANWITPSNWDQACWSVGCYKTAVCGAGQVVVGAGYNEVPLYVDGDEYGTIACSNLSGVTLGTNHWVNGPNLWAGSSATIKTAECPAGEEMTGLRFWMVSDMIDDERVDVQCAPVLTPTGWITVNSIGPTDSSGYCTVNVSWGSSYAVNPAVGIPTQIWGGGATGSNLNTGAWASTASGLRLALYNDGTWDSNGYVLNSSASNILGSATSPKCAPRSCSLPWGGTISSGSSVTAYQSSSVTSPSTCTSQTRTCSDSTLSGSYTNQSCTQWINYCTYNNDPNGNYWQWWKRDNPTTTYQFLYNGTVANGCAPAAPTLTATPGACGTGTINLSWTNAIAGPVIPGTLTNYILKDNGTQIYSGTATSFSHTGLVAGSSHSYTINVNFNSGSTVSPYSSAVAATAPSSCATNGVCAATHYNCTAGTSSGGMESSPNWVWTCNGSNGGTNASCSQPIPPPTSITGSCSASGTTASFSWVLPSGYTLSYFRVQDTTTVTNPSVWIPENVTDTGPSTSFTTTPGHSYQAWVHTRIPSVNYANGAWSNQIYANVVTCANPPPSTPTGFTVTPSTCGNNWLNLGWTAVSGATGYKVMRDNDGVWRDVGNVTAWSDTGLVLGSTHSYKVLAYNSGGNSASTASVSGTVASACAVNGVCAATHYNCTAGTSSGGMESSPNWVWTCNGSNGGTNASCSQPIPPPTSITASCSALGTTGYASWTLPSGYTLSYFRAYDRTTGTYPSVWIPENVSDTGPSTSFTTIPGHSYDMWAHTRLPSGAYSNQIYASVVTCANPPPSTPTGFTVTPSTCGNNWLNLGWNAVSGATGYKVERDNSGVWIDVGNVTSWSDTGLTLGSTHSYKVLAYNSGGNSASTASVSGTVASACAVNGVCAATHYNCTAGTSSGGMESSPNWVWTCNGSNGGTNASCSQPIPPPTSITASCSALGTTGYASWTLPSGYTLSYFRAYDRTTGTYPSVWIPENVSDTGPSTSFTTIPGHSYDMWAHTRLPSGAYSNQIYASVVTCILPLSVSATNLSITLPTTAFTENYSLTNGTSANTTCQLLDNVSSALTSYTSCTGSISYNAPAIAGVYGYYIRAYKSSTGEIKTGYFTVTVNAAPTYTITTSTGSGGTISPVGPVTVTYGGSQSFTITPSAGYSIASVSVDGVSQGAVSSYTFSNVTANHSISATFVATLSCVRDKTDNTFTGSTKITFTASGGTGSYTFVDNNNLPVCTPSSGGNFCSYTFSPNASAYGVFAVSDGDTANKKICTSPFSVVGDVTLSADPVRIQEGNSSTLTWSSKGYANSDCTVTGPNGFTSIHSANGNTSVSPTTQSTYKITCGTESKTVTINVVPRFDQF